MAAAIALGLVASQTVSQTVAVAQSGPQTEVNIVTGSEAGNYFDIAKELEILVELTTDLDLDVIPSSGSLDNIVSLTRFETIPLALSQRDVIAYIERIAEDDLDLAESTDNLRLLLPLYDEKIHLLARDGIESLEDLVGQTVAVGETGSGTFITSLVVLQQAEISPVDLATYGVREAIAALKAGEIDAMFFVVGAPAQIFQSEIRSSDNVNLIPIPAELLIQDNLLGRLYESTTLPASTYSWQSEAVPSVSVRSALYTTADANCDVLTPIVESIAENLEQLRANGNTVWRRVKIDPAALAAEPNLSECARSLTAR